MSGEEDGIRSNVELEETSVSVEMRANEPLYWYVVGLHTNTNDRDIHGVITLTQSPPTNITICQPTLVATTTHILQPHNTRTFGCHLVA